MPAANRLLITAVCAGLLAAGCASEERPFLLPPDQVEAEAPTTTAAPTVEDTTTTTSTTVDQGEPLGLITPTGVVVPIIEAIEGGYRVETPCAAEATLAFGTPIYRTDVVLDPGHGGEIETGAVGPNGLAEKDLNLTLSKAAARKLQDLGISVALTRTSDYRVPLRTRANIGDALMAEALVSIHHNAPVLNPSAGPGTEIFYQTAEPESGRLGGLIQEEVVEALSQFTDVNWVKAKEPGVVGVVKPDGTESYGMIRRPESIAVLVEFGYLANPTEAELFATDEYIDVASDALVAGIQRFLETDQTGVAPNAENRVFTPSGGTGGVTGCIDPPLE